MQQCEAAQQWQQQVLQASHMACCILHGLQRMAGREQGIVSRAAECAAGREGIPRALCPAQGGRALAAAALEPRQGWHHGAKQQNQVLCCGHWHAAQMAGTRVHKRGEVSRMRERPPPGSVVRAVGGGPARAGWVAMWFFVFTPYSRLSIARRRGALCYIS